MAKTILVGANHAGTACANTILSYPNQELTIYDQNNNISFLGCGMALWIGEQIHSGDGLFYAKPENFLAKGAKVNMESQVLSVDYEKKTVKVRLKDGQVMEDHYDNLVLATGSVPNRIPVKGFDLENVQMVKLYQNAEEVIEKLKNKGEFKKVCVLGGGYIGVELAEASGLFTCVWSLELVALGVGSLCAWVTAGSIARTGRKFIWEDERIRFSVS